MVKMHLPEVCPWTTLGNFRFPAPSSCINWYWVTLL